MAPSARAPSPLPKLRFWRGGRKGAPGRREGPRAAAQGRCPNGAGAAAAPPHPGERLSRGRAGLAPPPPRRPPHVRPSPGAAALCRRRRRGCLRATPSGFPDRPPAGRAAGPQAAARRRGAQCRALHWPPSPGKSRQPARVGQAKRPTAERPRGAFLWLGRKVLLCGVGTVLRLRRYHLQTVLDVLNMMLVKLCVCGWEGGVTVLRGVSQAEKKKKIVSRAVCS